MKPQKLKSSTDEPSEDTKDTGFECGFNLPLRRWIAIVLVIVALISYPTMITIWFVRRQYANKIYEGYSYLMEHHKKYKKPKEDTKPKESALKKKLVIFCKKCGIFHGCADDENDGNNYFVTKEEKALKKKEEASLCTKFCIFHGCIDDENDGGNYNITEKGDEFTVQKGLFIRPRSDHGLPMSVTH